MYAAYKAAMEHKGQPTVILAKTVKGYGLGEAGEGKNISHQQKKMNEKELREFRERFNIPISDDVIAETPFFRPPPDSPEIKYLLERRKALGGFLPARKVTAPPLDVPKLDSFAEFFQGSTSEASTTMAFVRLLSVLLRHKSISRHIVPIIPDEARTFGLDALFHDIGIYSSKGQLYEPVDSKSLLYYHEAKDGQILEEGITEAGSMCVVHRGGHQLRHARRADDSVLHLLLDVRPAARRRFVLARRRHPGEGLFARRDLRPHHAQRRRPATSGRPQPAARQHHSRRCLPYDPAFGYELAVIIADGLRRMYVEGEDIFYYLSLYNENYAMPPMPAGVEDGILKGLYKFKPARNFRARLSRHRMPERYDQGPHFRQRPDHQLGVEGAGNSGRTIRRLRRCLERDELQTAPHRRDPLPALEHAAPDAAAEKILRRNPAGERAGGLCRRVRQHPHRARPDCAVGSGRIVHARHGRFWPQRHARAAAPIF